MMAAMPKPPSNSITGGEMARVETFFMRSRKNSRFSRWNRPISYSSRQKALTILLPTRVSCNWLFSRLMETWLEVEMRRRRLPNLMMGNTAMGKTTTAMRARRHSR